MNIILLDILEDRKKLLPLTFTRPISELRVGILTIKEKWEKYLNAKASYYTEQYLQIKYPLDAGPENYVINSVILPNETIIQTLKNAPANTVFTGKEGNFLFGKLDKENFDPQNITKNKTAIYDGEITRIEHLWDIYRLNDKEIAADFKLLTSNAESAKISSTNTVFSPGRIFIHPTAQVECAILNPLDGYIYIGPGATIMEGTTVRGSLAMCEHSVLKMQAKIYGATTLGPYCKVGGEVNNSVLTGYSNKAHDGFLGNAVIGEWCNFGADTNNSNLKNNYKNVKVWDYSKESFIDTGLQFAGLFMGDHSKTGINTMLNTGTVVGVAANIFGPGFPRNFIPSFSWGGPQGFIEHRPEKAMETASLMMARRNISLTPEDKAILRHIYNITQKYRHNYH